MMEKVYINQRWRNWEKKRQIEREIKRERDKDRERERESAVKKESDRK